MKKEINKGVNQCGKIFGGIMLVVCLIWTSNMSAQGFEVTPVGLRDSSDTEKSFVVIEVDSSSASELFNNAKRYIIQTYKNPDFVQKGILENEYIRFDTYVPHLASINAGLTMLKYDANYSTELYFKDGKIKFEIIELEIETDGVPLHFTSKGGLSGWFIYNKKGVLKQPNAKRDIELYFNSMIANLVSYLNGETKDEDDW